MSARKRCGTVEFGNAVWALRVERRTDRAREADVQPIRGESSAAGACRVVDAAVQQRPQPECQSQTRCGELPCSARGPDAERCRACVPELRLRRPKQRRRIRGAVGRTSCTALRMCPVRDPTCGRTFRPSEVRESWLYPRCRRCEHASVACGRVLRPGDAIVTRTAQRLRSAEAMRSPSADSPCDSG